MHHTSAAADNRPVALRDSTGAPVELTRVTPTRGIRIVFWGLRVYIGLMVALVIIGFIRGMH
jgi:hypothetical protein